MRGRALGGLELVVDAVLAVLLLLAHLDALHVVGELRRLTLFLHAHGHRQKDPPTTGLGWARRSRRRHRLRCRAFGHRRCRLDDGRRRRCGHWNRCRFRRRDLARRLGRRWLGLSPGWWLEGRRGFKRGRGCWRWHRFRCARRGRHRCGHWQRDWLRQRSRCAYRGGGRRRLTAGSLAGVTDPPENAAGQHQACDGDAGPQPIAGGRGAWVGWGCHRRRRHRGLR